MRHGRALARFGLAFVAMLLGYEQPELEYALRAVLADADDAEVARQVETLARKHRKVYAAHRRLMTPALQLLRGDGVDEASARLVAHTAIHALRSAASAWPWRAELQGTALGDAVDAAFHAAQRADGAGVVRALRPETRRGASPELGAILAAIVEAYGAEAHGGEVLERMEVPRPRRTIPPPGFDLDRGRESRAEIVLAVLRAHDVQLKEVDRGRLRPMTRDDLAEAILRDPFWDDIDASVGEDGVVARILRGEPSPAIDLSRLGHPQVYIRRIVR